MLEAHSYTRIGLGLESLGGVVVHGDNLGGCHDLYTLTLVAFCFEQLFDALFVAKEHHF